MNKGNLSSFELFILTVIGATVCSCAKDEGSPPESAAVVTQGQNTNPKVGDFAVYAQNSATLRDRVVVSSGDVGVKNISTGPTLITGYELAIASQAQVDTKRNVIANRLLLQDRASVGDIQANKLTNQFGSYTHLYPFPTSMPALPTVSAVTPGTTAYTVNMGQIVTINPSNFAAVTLKTKATLRLNGGTYNWASLQLDDETRLEALAPVQIRIAGRVATLARVYVGPASGTTLVARDIRVEASGKNGTGGQLNETPKASVYGNDNTLNALLVVPNGTLQIGQRAAILGAVAAKDVYIDIDSKTTYQSGFAPPPCVPVDCNDQNPCTTDVCTEGTCSHSPLAAGTSCSDGNGCNGAETCNGQGTCVAGTPVVCQATDICHDVGTCDTATGTCSNPPKPDGAACNDGNACTTTDQCVAGVCGGTNPVQCTALDQCHAAGQCDPATGQCSNPNLPDGNPCDDSNLCTLGDVCSNGACTAGTPLLCAALDQCHEPGTCDLSTGTCSTPAKQDGTLCDDSNACTLGETCQAGTCSYGTAVPIDDNNPCTADACDVASGVAHIPVPAGTPCSDGNACNGTELCSGIGTCLAGQAPVVDDNNPCTTDTCEPAQGVTHTPLEAGTTWAQNGKTCVFDDFDGSTLAPRWSGTPIGAPPTYIVDGSRITITDAAAASDSGTANQIVWSRAIGTEDFNIGFEVGWSSNAEQQTLAGIGLTNASNQLELRAGIKDESPTTGGGPFVALLTGQSWTGTNAETGSARLRLVRQAGTLSVLLNGQAVSTAPFTADVQHIVIFTAKSSGDSAPEFGTAWLGEISDCYPNVDWDSAAACSDGNACNGTETCNGSGSCGSGTPPVVADDANPCTTDVCDPTLPDQYHQPLDGVACGAGDICQGTGPSICREGQCLPQCELVPFGADNLSYKVYDYDTVPESYWQYTFDDSQFAVGAAPFGSGGFCPIQANRKTQWPGYTELVVRRWIQLTGTESDLQIDIAIDNDIEIYFNEVNITGGLTSHEGCANDNLLTFTIPASQLRPGQNLLAMHARDRGTEAALDVHLTSGCAGSVPPIDDDNPCTADTCDPVTGISHTPVAEGTSCGINSTCDANGQCVLNSCVIGDAENVGAAQDVNLFGQIVYFADGQSIPAGRYAVTYIDGCMKYASFQGWTINAIPGACQWWLVGNSSADHKLVLPGTVGTTAGEGAFANFDDCVTANLQVPPIEFDHTGGALGVWLADGPYSDNLPGLDGRNPRWRLTRLNDCTD